QDAVMPARVVIAAVPWHALGALFATVPSSLAGLVRHATDLASSPIVTVNLWLDRPVLDEAFVGMPGRAFQWVFDRARLIGPSQSHLSFVSSGAEAICAA